MFLKFYLRHMMIRKNKVAVKYNGIGDLPLLSSKQTRGNQKEN